MEKLVSGIQRQLETSGESEVQAQTIGAMVMEGLKGLDSVAYIRFASVYKDFREAKDFEDLVVSVKEVGGEKSIAITACGACQRDEIARSSKKPRRRDFLGEPGYEVADRAE